MRAPCLAAAAIALAALLPAAAPAASPQPDTLLYVSLQDTNQIAVYAGRNGRTPLELITAGVTGPTAICVDPAGNLYVANANNTVTVYPQHATAPALTYSQGVSTPTYLAVDQAGGLYVANAGNSTVVQYPPNSQTPSRTLSFAGPPNGLAVDLHGTLYVLTSTGDIEAFAPSSMTGSSFGLSIQLQPTGLAIDPNGDFLVNQLGVGGITTIARLPPHTASGIITFASASPSSFAFGADGDLYTGVNTQGRAVREKYPQQNVANVIDALPGTSSDVAVFPPLSR